MAEYINVEEGLRRVVNNKKLFAKLLTKFKKETNLNEFLSSIEAKDYEKAQISAHTLKGISGNLSLTALYEQAIVIEAQLKNKTVEEGAVENITACFNETLKVIDEVLESNGY
jgi:two-component system sensor histidine kinase/response regulator